MKKYYLLALTMSLLILFCSLQLKSQVSEGGTPPSSTFAITADNIDHIIIPAPNVENLLIEDKAANEKGDPFRFGVILPVNLNMGNSGTWTDLPDGRRIWRLAISSKDALGLSVLYSEFIMPQSGKLFIYNENQTKILGAFTHNNNPKKEEWANEFVYGDKVIIEYVESGRSLNNPALQISGISYAYKVVPFVVEPNSSKVGESEFCEVNINCSPEGDNWQDEQRGVALISITIGASNYLCTGSLVNNTNQDCTPYFLSAQHCGDGASTADFNQWVFYFGYEGAGCPDPTSAYYQVAITGSTKKADAANSPGSTSDMLLLLFNNSNFGTYIPYFNGWNRTNTASTSGVSIHHPAGDIKKISTYTSTLGNYGGTHWEVFWSATTNGHGVTEGGSSGSPIFNNSGLVVGTLTGGSSYCTATSQSDIYGKFYYHWDQNGTADADRLKPWLDPGNTGVTTMSGIDYPCSTGINAEFVGTPTAVVPGGSVTFTDNSTGSPTTWNWTFTDGSPSSSTSQTPPAITYANIGTYTVSLYVSDGLTNDTETKVNYITVAPPSSGFSLDFEACSDFSTDFSPWTLNDVDGSATYGSNDVDFTGEGDPMAFIAMNASQTTPAWTGNEAHGGQRYGASFATLPPASGGVQPNADWLISPLFQLGTNSSISLWVKSITDLYGLERYNIGVSTTNNDPGSFTLISASPYEEAPITWTQETFDLSAYDNQSVYIAINCVSDDAFVFMIDDIEINTTITSIDGIKDEVQNISIYPNPASDYINVVSSFSGENMQITVTNMIGKVIDLVTYNNFSAGEYKIDMSEFDAGIYYININADNKVISEKITLIK